MAEYSGLQGSYNMENDDGNAAAEVTECAENTPWTANTLNTYVSESNNDKSDSSSAQLQINCTMVKVDALKLRLFLVNVWFTTPSIGQTNAHKSTGKPLVFFLYLHVNIINKMWA